MRKRYVKLCCLMLAVTLAGFTGTAQAKRHLLLGTSTVGGSSYVLGGAWAKLIGDRSPDLDISVEVTGGADSNIILVQNKEMEVGWATTWQAGIRFNGEDKDGKKYPDIRAFVPLYASYVHIYCLADQPVARLSDLEGKRVASASAGSASDLATKAVLGALNIRIKKQNGLSTSAIADSLRDRQSDAAFTVTGIPGPFMLDLESTRDVRMIPISREEMSVLLKAVPYWREGVIPKGTYKNMTGDVRVITLWNIGITHKNLDEELVYRLTKITLENMALIGNTVRDVSATVAADILFSPIPIHKGALRYYREVGIAVPDHLIPPEAR